MEVRFSSVAAVVRPPTECGRREREKRRKPRVRSGGRRCLGRMRNTLRTVIMDCDGVLSVLACVCAAFAVGTKAADSRGMPRLFVILKTSGRRLAAAARNPGVKPLPPSAVSSGKGRRPASLPQKKIRNLDLIEKACLFDILILLAGSAHSFDG